jgi:transcription antitermination factor NusG
MLSSSLADAYNLADAYSKAVDWFALRVMSNCERAVVTSLSGKGFDVCLPLCKSQSRSRQKAKEKEKALFPGYVFCCFDPGVPLPVITVPHVVSIVGRGRTPEPIDPTEMRMVQQLAASGVTAEPYPHLRTGERVRISEGPLEGVEGFVVREQGRDRLVISVSLLQRSVAAEVERCWVEPLAVLARSVAASNMQSVRTALPVR